ncbi:MULTISPECIES: type II secretion system minor pseudopilin GspK [Serratia]|uniref:type II secretion system minor pseudopilin GspK n=1 Tax=Serratia TaxID=613 RepID=UPI000EFB4A25|nr:MULTISPECIES: type II secretion system minor pseudopilin GspK [Serratia]MBH2800249.1 type II secretion system minor pseudopilin GspK [Serratia ureilytica]MBH2819895.1 type II secretion system minor pseudopilin GspK [Serratia ureilytica]MBH2963750.1 type II secretion system minor pseudopilin GspK [Serratia ureilytica]
MNKQRGMALLMVLLMMSLMAIVAVNINDNWQRSLVRTQSQQDRLRAKWLLLGGESYARQRLQQAGEQRKAWGASGVTFSMRTEEGEVAIRLRRVDACFNLNALIRAAGPADVGDSEGGTPNKERRIFMLLLNNQGIAAAQAGAIADAIVARAYGEGYLMGDVSELRELAGIDRELYLRLAPLLCAAPDAELRLNPDAVNDAQLPLLRAMLMNALSDERLRALLAARPPQGWQTLAFLSQEKALQALGEDGLGERLIFDDNRWIAQLQLRLNDGRYRLVSALQPGPSGVTVSGRRFDRGEG